MPVISRKITSSPIGVADYNSLNPGDNNTTKLHDESELQNKYAKIFTTMSEQLKTKITKYQEINKDNNDFSELNKILENILRIIHMNKQLCANPVQRTRAIWFDTKKFNSDKVSEFCDNMQFMILEIQEIIDNNDNFTGKVTMMKANLTKYGYDYFAKLVGGRKTKKQKRQGRTKKNKKTKRRRIQKKTITKCKK